MKFFLISLGFLLTVILLSCGDAHTDHMDSVPGKQIKIVPSSSSPESDTQESPSVPVPAGSKAPPSKKVKRSQSEQDTLRPTLA